MFNSMFLKHGMVGLSIPDFLGVEVDFCMVGIISIVGKSLKLGKWEELNCEIVIREDDAVSLL